jgi:hypothetical protein
MGVPRGGGERGGGGGLARLTGALSPKTGEAGSLIGGALVTVPHGLNPFDQVKAVQTV